MPLDNITAFEPNTPYDHYDTTETYTSPIGDIQIIKTYPYGFRKLVRKDGGPLPSEYTYDYTGPIQARQAKDKLIKELEDAQELQKPKRRVRAKDE